MQQYVQEGTGITLLRVEDILTELEAHLETENNEITESQQRKRKRWKVEAGIYQVKTAAPDIDMSDLCASMGPESYFPCPECQLGGLVVVLPPSGFTRP